VTRNVMVGGVVFLLAATAARTQAEVRPGAFRSAALGRDVSYVIDLPASYDSSPQRRYPVVYALHGLFEGPDFWQQRGLATILARLRAEAAVPEFLLVAVDGGNSFFVNGGSGRFEDLVTQDLIAHVESSYRVVPGRASRALLGISMGGYAALRIAFERPELFDAVATHSAMLLERVPSPQEGAGRWHMAAFQAVFGNPIDSALWAANDPLVAARKIEAKHSPALYFDCGSEDRYGLASGNRELDRILGERGIAHTFALAPGDHGYEFVRSRIETSLGFLGRALSAR